MPRHAEGPGPSAPGGFAPTVRRLLALAAPFAARMSLAVLLGAVTIGSSVGLLTTSAYLIARAALRPSIADLQVAIVGVRFFGIARGVARYLERVVSHDVTFRLLARLRGWFYRALEPLAPARLVHYRSGDLLARIVADVDTLQEFFLRAVAPPAVALLAGGLAVAFLAFFDPRLALTLAAFLLAAGVGLPLVVRALSRRIGRRVVSVRAELDATLVEGIQGMADILAFGQERGFLERVQKLGDELTSLQGRTAWIGAGHLALSGLASNLAALAVLAGGIWLVVGGRLDGLWLAVLAMAALASFEAVLPLAPALQHLDSSLEAARRLFEVVDAQPEVIDPPLPAPLPVSGDVCLSVEGLRFWYGPGERAALDGISFALHTGKTLAVVGPSGAGKSTLVWVLLRFLDYRSGRIMLDGRELREFDQEEWRQRVGVVSQHTHLFNATVRENLLMARPGATEADLVQAAQRAQIHEFIQALPEGYDTAIGELGQRLSAGERQRLAIARALLKDAPLLILDEPTANLDPLTERAILDALPSLMAGRTTLIITHRLAGLEMADEILVLEEGRIAERGRHFDLLEAGGLYRRMWDLQTQLLQ